MRALHTHAQLKAVEQYTSQQQQQHQQPPRQQRQHQQHNDEYQHTETTLYSHTIYVTEAHQSRSLTCQTDSLCLVWLDLLASVGMALALAWFGSILFTTGHPILWLRFSYIFYFSLQHNHFRNYSSVSQYRVLGSVLSVHNMQYGCVFFFIHVYLFCCILISFLLTAMAISQLLLFFLSAFVCRCDFFHCCLLYIYLCAKEGKKATTATSTITRTAYNCNVGKETLVMIRNRYALLATHRLIL